MQQKSRIIRRVKTNALLAQERKVHYEGGRMTSVQIPISFPIINMPTGVTPSEGIFTVAVDYYNPGPPKKGVDPLTLTSVSSRASRRQ
jgi:hypothetical protein